MSLQCPACQKTVPAGDVNIGVDLARCTACGEVFRPCATMPPGSDTAADEPPRPTPEPPPEGTKVRIEDQGGSLLVRFPPFGFNGAVLSLIVFAILWWSFLGAFVGFGLSGVINALESDDQAPPQETAIEAESPLESEPSTAEKHSDQPDVSTGQEPHFLSAGVIIAGLFMLPFFGIGVLMIWAILSQILGRTRVRLATDGCSYRRSLLVFGRSRTASLAETSVRWTDESPAPGRRASGTSATPNPSTKRKEPHILLTLGGWATPLGARLSLREQKWVFREMRTWLKRYAEGEAEPFAWMR